jgi:hypothetical protein
MPPEEAQVLANIIGQLGVLEDEAKTSSVKVGAMVTMNVLLCFKLLTARRLPA